jgi:hypothetical protein
LSNFVNKEFDEKYFLRDIFENYGIYETFEQRTNLTIPEIE